jgi:hypothetical protein
LKYYNLLWWQGMDLIGFVVISIYCAVLDWMILVELYLFFQGTKCELKSSVNKGPPGNHSLRFSSTWPVVFQQLSGPRWGTVVSVYVQAAHSGDESFSTYILNKGSTATWLQVIGAMEEWGLLLPNLDPSHPQEELPV